jgi:16S rRNA (uracil1498-N3)-methyltransferase
VGRIDFTARRLFVDAPFRAGLVIALAPAQAHYLINVLRLGEGTALLIFNGRDGEWLAHLARSKPKSASLAIDSQVRGQSKGVDLDLLFAPLKHARLDYLVQKAVEMGVARLIPVLTRRTHVARLNHGRMRANVIEAAEQCGILNLPDVTPETSLSQVLDTWSGERLLIFCDEAAPMQDPLAALAMHGQAAGGRGSLALMVGPEGGFDDDERRQILNLPKVVRLSLGPRILRADTAAVAALGLVQAVLGDWY